MGKKVEIKNKLNFGKIFNFCITIIVISILSVLISFNVLLNFPIYLKSSNFEGYALLPLTLFGITLLGGIFDNKLNNSMPVFKKIFNSSLCFFSSFLGFFIMATVASAIDFLWNSIWGIIVFLIFVIAFLFANVGFATGIVILTNALIKHRKDYS